MTAYLGNRKHLCKKKRGGKKQRVGSESPSQKHTESARVETCATLAELCT